MLKSGRVRRASGTSAVFATAAVEDLLKKILDSIADLLCPEPSDGEENKKITKRVTPAMLMQALRQDADLSKLYNGFTFVTQDTLGKSTDVILTSAKRKQRKEALDVAKKERAAKKANSAAA